MPRLKDIMNEVDCLSGGTDDSFWVRNDEVKRIPYIKVILNRKNSWLIRLVCNSEDRWFPKRRCILLEEDNVILVPHWMDGYKSGERYG